VSFCGALDEYEFPLAVVEGKPVWGDSLLYSENGTEYDMKKLYVSPAVLKKLSWNPPKPKIVMVELLREDAEYLANWIEPIRLANACRKALGG
jgi:hypothetical protein